MTAFFVPTANTPEEAEAYYARFLRQNPYPQSTSGRLFRVTYLDIHNIIAEVGRELIGWGGPEDVVLAVIEGSNIVTIHTTQRGIVSSVPIYIAPDEIRERIYFDDFPAGMNAARAELVEADDYLSRPGR